MVWTMDTFENSVQCNCVYNMYRRNSDHNVVCRDIWFHIKRNLGRFLVTFRSLLASSEVPKAPNFC